MRILSSTLTLNGLKFHAYHGVLDQERLVGGEFIVDLSLNVIGMGALYSDSLGDTINYSAIIDVIRHEMSIPSSLIEHVAGRIARALLKSFSTITVGTITVTKVHPPVSTPISGASVSITFSRN